MPEKGNGDPPQNHDCVVDDEQGTLSREELEDRNTQRALYVITGEEAKVVIHDGGVSQGTGLNPIFDNIGKVKSILNRLITLMGLLAIVLLLWRIGLLLRILGVAG